MSRLYALAGALALAVILTGAAVRAEDKDDKLPTTKEIMKKAHGKEGLRAILTKDIKSKDWEDAAKTAKEWKTLSDALAKNKPKKGEPESWKEKTGEYSKTLDHLVKAIDDKNAKEAQGALKTIGSACGTCHKSHK